MFEPNIKILSEEEMQENRRQGGIRSVPLTGKKYYCSEKVAAGFKHFFHGRGHIGKIGVEKDGRYFIQIFSIDQEIRPLLAALYSDKAFHQFLNDCYDKACDIYKKRLEAAKAAHEADQDNSKNCQTEIEMLQNEQSSRSADRILLQNQKAKKTMPAFDKGDFKTWSSLSAEDAQESKDRLTAKKTELLQKINDIDTILKGEKR